MLSPSRAAQLLALVTVLGGGSPALATPILAPVSATASSVDPFGGNPTNLINQSDLSAPYTSGVTDFDTYVPSTTVGNASGIGVLGGAGAPPASFTFDLGGAISIDAIAIWNQFGTAALNTFTVQTSLLSDFSVAQTFGTFTMSVFGGSTSLHADVFTFPSTTAGFVRINALTNAGFPSAVRMNEVALRESPAATVPEPASFVLIGTGLLAVARRRFVARRR